LTASPNCTAIFTRPHAPPRRQASNNASSSRPAVPTAARRSASAGARPLPDRPAALCAPSAGSQRPPPPAGLLAHATVRSLVHARYGFGKGELRLREQGRRLSEGHCRYEINGENYRSPMRARRRVAGAGLVAKQLDAMSLKLLREFTFGDCFCVLPRKLRSKVRRGQHLGMAATPHGGSSCGGRFIFKGMLDSSWPQYGCLHSFGRVMNIRKSCLAKWNILCQPKDQGIEGLMS
jgi:hypothetical protein